MSHIVGIGYYCCDQIAIEVTIRSLFISLRIFDVDALVHAISSVVHKKVNLSREIFRISILAYF